MTLYDVWLNLLQAWVSTLTFCKNHPTVPGLLFLMLRLNNIRRAVNKNLPKQFRDTTDADILEIKEALRLLLKHQGVMGEWQSNGLQSGLKRHPLFFSKLLKYLRKATKSVYPQRRRSKMNWITTNISKKLSALIIGAAVTALNKKFDLQIDPNDIITLWVGVIAYIGVQGHVDARKALVATTAAAAQVVKGMIPQVAPDPNMTYADITPVVRKVHDTFNGILKDLQNGNTSAFTKEDMMSAYLSLDAYFNSVRQPEPLKVVS